MVGRSSFKPDRFGFRDLLMLAAVVLLYAAFAFGLIAMRRDYLEWADKRFPEFARREMPVIRPAKARLTDPR